MSIGPLSFRGEKKERNNKTKQKQAYIIAHLGVFVTELPTISYNPHPSFSIRACQ
jgi:hypothetical protein